MPADTIDFSTPDASRYSLVLGLEMVGRDDLDCRVELNTKGQSPGTYKTIVTIYSTQQDYKLRRSELTIKMT
jgi:hypothetical protein